MGKVKGIVRPDIAREPRLVAWRRGVAAVLAAAAGITTLAAQFHAGTPSALGAARAVHGSELLPLHALGIAGGLGLLVVAHGLWRGKRHAIYVGIAVLCFLAVGRVALGQGALDGGLELLLALLLFANRGAFCRGQRRPGRNVKVSGTIALGGAAALYAAYAIAVIAKTHGTDVDEAVVEAGRTLVGGASPASAGTSLALAVDALVAIMVVAGATFLHGLLRPATPNEGHLPEEHARALEILREHGADSLDPFSLREDKALHFAGGGFLSYRVLRETAVVSGEPIGSAGSAPQVLRSFMGFAEENGWDVVMTGASDRNLAEFRELGLRTLRIGDEAVVDPQSFSLEGRAIRKVRQSVSRVVRRGWSVEVVEDQDLTPALCADLCRVEADWRGRQHRLIGFAMTLGRLVGANEEQDGIYVLGRDADGVVRSYLRFAAYRGGLSLDVMRRPGDEPNGLTEAQVVAAIDYARAKGLGQLSLNFAGFAHLMAADAVLNRSQKLLRFVLRAMHGRFQLERLAHFNAKFMPGWQPRYLLYGRLTHLPVAALRVLQAEAYLRGPSSPEKPGRWESRPMAPELAPAAAPAVPRLRPTIWSRWVAGAVAVWVLLAGATQLLVGSGATATATPVRVNAHYAGSKWSFVYRRGDQRLRSNVLYVPKGRPVVIHFSTAPGRAGLRGVDAASVLARRLRMRAVRPSTIRLVVPRYGSYGIGFSHRGVYPLHWSGRCSHHHGLVKAKVIKPRAFRARIRGPLAPRLIFHAHGLRRHSESGKHRPSA